MLVSFSSGLRARGRFGCCVFVGLRIVVCVNAVVLMLCVAYWWFILLLVRFLLVFWFKVFSCGLVVV